MKTDDPLLREVFAGDELAQRRADSLAKGLRIFRRRRMVRTAAPMAGALVLLAGMGILLPRTPRVSTNVAEFKADAAPKVSSGIRRINDEELFALFPNRSVAIIGEGDKARFVFADAGARD